MSQLLAYNLTLAPVALAAGNSPTTLPASAAAGARGEGYDVTGELDGLSNPDYLLLQAQVLAGDFVLEWDDSPSYSTPGLTVIFDASSANSLPPRIVFRPGATGADAPGGNVYTDEAACIAAIASNKSNGQLTVEFDSRFSLETFTFDFGSGPKTRPVCAITQVWPMDNVRVSCWHGTGEPGEVFGGFLALSTTNIEFRDHPDQGAFPGIGGKFENLTMIDGNELYIINACTVAGSGVIPISLPANRFLGPGEDGAHFIIQGTFVQFDIFDELATPMFEVVDLGPGFRDPYASINMRGSFNNAFGAWLHNHNTPARPLVNIPADTTLNMLIGAGAVRNNTIEGTGHLSYEVYGASMGAAFETSTQDTFDGTTSYSNRNVANSVLVLKSDSYFINGAPSPAFPTFTDGGYSVALGMNMVNAAAPVRVEFFVPAGPKKGELFTLKDISVPGVGAGAGPGNELSIFGRINSPDAVITRTVPSSLVIAGKLTFVADSGGDSLITGNSADNAVDFTGILAGESLTITDAGNPANNIVVTALTDGVAGSLAITGVVLTDEEPIRDTIDGSSDPYVINTPNGSVSLRSDGGTDWFVVSEYKAHAIDHIVYRPGATGADAGDDSVYTDEDACIAAIDSLKGSGGQLTVEFDSRFSLETFTLPSFVGPIERPVCAITKEWDMDNVRVSCWHGTGEPGHLAGGVLGLSTTSIEFRDHPDQGAFPGVGGKFINMTLIEGDEMYFINACTAAGSGVIPIPLPSNRFFGPSVDGAHLLVRGSFIQFDIIDELATPMFEVQVDTTPNPFGQDGYATINMNGSFNNSFGAWVLNHGVARPLVNIPATTQLNLLMGAGSVRANTVEGVGILSYEVYGASGMNGIANSGQQDSFDGTIEYGTVFRNNSVFVIPTESTNNGFETGVVHSAWRRIKMINPGVPKACDLFIQAGPKNGELVVVSDSSIPGVDAGAGPGQEITVWPFVHGPDATITRTLPGTPDDAFTFADPDVTLTDSTASFDTSLIGQNVVIASATTPANNGTFEITAVTPTTLVYTNALGVAEAQGAATYTTILVIDGKADFIADFETSGNGLIQQAGRTFQRDAGQAVDFTGILAGEQVIVSGTTLNDGAYLALTDGDATSLAIDGLLPADEETARDTINGVFAPRTINTFGGSVSLRSDGGTNWAVLGEVGADLDTLPERWFQDNVTASQADVDLGTKVSVTFPDFEATRAGSIVGLRTRLNAAITDASADSAIVTVTINGVEGTLAVSHASGGNASGGKATQPAGIDTYVEGDLIGVSITTLASFLPITTDLEACLEITDS